MPNEHGDVMDVDSFKRAILHAKELRHILVMRGFNTEESADASKVIEEALREQLYERHGVQVT